MKERPIIFNGIMVKAILDGNKTMTRRPIKGLDGSRWETSLLESGRWQEAIDCPYKIGMGLWVREKWGVHSMFNDTKPSKLGRGHRIWYSEEVLPVGSKHRPSIHMPRWASRITLEITYIRVERVQDITEEDAIREGCEGKYTDDENGFELMTARDAFAELWKSIYGQDAWEKNLWVWVISFVRRSK